MRSVLARVPERICITLILQEDARAAVVPGAGCVGCYD